MKRQLYILFLIAFCILCAGCASTQVESTPFPQAEPQTELSRHYFRAGMVYYDLSEFRKAKQNFKKAVEADQTLTDARRFMYRIEFILGERVATFDDDDLPCRASALLEEQRNELEKDYTKGKHLFNAKEYERARKFFEQCLERIRWFPYPIDFGINYELLCKKAILECDRKIAAGK